MKRATAYVLCRQLMACAILAFVALALAPAEAKNKGRNRSAQAEEIVAESEQARDAGDTEKELELLGEALAAAGAESHAAYRVYEKIKQNYSDRGNALRAAETAERQLPTARNAGQELHVLVSMVSLYSALHQNQQAAGALERLERLLPRLRSSDGWERQRHWWQAEIAKAKAAFHTRAGHLPQAEDAWKACLSSGEAALKDNPDREGSALFLDCARGLIGVQIATGQLAAAGDMADRLRMAADRVLEIKKRPAIGVRVRQILGHLAVEQGRPEEARRLYLEALALLEAANSADSSVRAAALRLQLAALDMLAGRWQQALEFHQQREAALRRAQAERGSVSLYSVEYAYTLLRLGRAQDAVTMMGRIVEARRKVYDEGSLYLWEANAFYGIALAAAGRRDEAMRELRAAIPKMLDISKGERASAEAGVLRTARLNWLLDGYIALLSDVAGGGVPGQDAAGATDEAFRLSDLARGSTVQRALAASASRAGISDPALADLARREQDLQREISALAESIGNLLARGRVAEQDKVVADMRASVAKLRAEHARAQAEIERRFPEYGALLDPKPVGMAAVQKLLKPGEALISVYAGSDRTLVWAIPASGAPRFAVVPLSGAQLDQKVAALRKALDPNAEAEGKLPKFEFDVAHELYARLLAPVEAGWKGARELIVVPHGRIGQLPLGVLLTEPWSAAAANVPYAEMAAAPWLIKQVAISQLPAAIALPALRTQGRAARAERPFIGFGDPVFAAAPAAAAAPATAATATRGMKRRNLVLAAEKPAVPGAEAAAVSKIDFSLLPQLPDTAQEIAEVAAVLAADKARDVFLGNRATEAQVNKTDLSSYRVVMFATHGLMNGEMPGLYQPALALSNPAITGDGGDGMLTMEEILGLKLRADWVVLSACNSAAAGEQSGESVSGLGRAFFYAGAKSLLVTNWAVETESARMLTTEVFRLQAADPGLPRARALQQSSLALMKKSAGNDYSYAHPMFWAPYSLVGDGG